MFALTQKSKGPSADLGCEELALHPAMLSKSLPKKKSGNCLSPQLPRLREMIQIHSGRRFKKKAAIRYEWLLLGKFFPGGFCYC